MCMGCKHPSLAEEEELQRRKLAQKQTVLLLGELAGPGAMNTVERRE